MKRRSYIPFIAIAGALFVAGLVLGAGKSSDDTSVANTASKVLLAIGLVSLVVTGILEAVARRRVRHSPTSHREVAEHRRQAVYDGNHRR